MSNLMNKERLLNRFLKYVQCDSESFNEKNFCLLLEEELTAMGYTFARDEEAGKKAGSNGWNLYVKVEGEDPSLDPIMLCSHLDTVSPGVGIKPVVENGFVRSSGDTILAADDKSGIALCMELLECLKESGTKPARTVEILFTVCEEVGLLGSANADYSPFVSKMALALDFTGDMGYITIKSASICRLFFEVIGKPAHAANAPQDGINSFKAAMEAAVQIPTGNVDDISVMNVAEVHCASALNIVPEKTTFGVEIRSFTVERTNEWRDHCIELVKQSCEKYGAKYSVKEVRVIEPANVPEDSVLVNHTKAAMERVGIAPKPLAIYGGSDATHLFNNGIHACCICTGMDGAHALSEFLNLEDFSKASDLIWELTR